MYTLRSWGAQHDESYTMLPDFPGYPVTIRAALTLLFALSDVGADKFKWMLYGDDDTVWVVPAVLKLLNEAGLNHDDPHMINDYHTECWKLHQPNGCVESKVGADPRCLPCPTGQSFCPCKIPPGCTQLDNWAVQNCSVQARILPYGGAGIIYSVGMLRLLAQDPQFYPSLVLRDVVPNEPWGDRVVADAPRIKGYGFTDITKHKDPSADTYRMFGAISLINDPRSPADFLVAVTEAAKHQPHNMRVALSIHVRTAVAIAGKHDVVQDFLPVYRQIVHTMYSFHHNDTQAHAKAP
ncbi:hypothetical protein GPECTOR_30g159 [Gonium pectorale]|uniref:Hexosyltransferase n=1 Tax=Gonium pectorale TaxID=33097 RepID=A0A150GE01_GONPE|nr:hypothetical protein GPECTOR_30g159 [Gonium pectorale]|eukprot:KXZ48064.1 hypothetical protein GPECTOR_30g159 [Gonium pectorale]